MQILALGFRHLGQMVFRNYGNGQGTNKIQMERPLPVLFLNTGNQTVVFFMANDVSGVILEESVPCIALSKNDSYVMSACGGKVSLFNMMTFKVMTTFMPAPPASTFLAFHPQDK